MKILFYSAKDFETIYLEKSNNKQYDIKLIPDTLSINTVIKAKGFTAVSIFAGDDASAKVLEALYKNGIKFIAVRAAGYDNVDLQKANELGISVANVPAYSPYAIAEHAVALILALNRKIVIADKQVHNQNFTVGNLIGFDLHNKTVGIIGTGTIGSILGKIMYGFGCRLLAYDLHENKLLANNYEIEYVDLPTLCRKSNIISIHTCLTPATKHIINKNLIGMMQHGVMIINTSRGGCVNTSDIIDGLDNNHIGYYGADVYENEKGIFFYDYSKKELTDHILKKLLATPNVLITPHQAFATQEALSNIADTTFYNLNCWKDNLKSKNELTSINIASTAI